MTLANFIPQLWAAAFLENLNNAHVYANVVNRDYEGEIRAHGDTVRINSIGRVTVAPYTRNTFNLTPEILDGANQTMTIDQANYFYYAVDDLDKAQAKGSLMAAASKEAAWAMNDTIDSDLAAVIRAGVPTAATNTRTAATVGTGAGDEDAFEILVDLSVMLDVTNTPKVDRWCVVPPWFVGVLLKDPRFTSFGTEGNLRRAMSGDFMETLLGMRLYVSNNVPRSGDGYYVLAGYKGAVSFAEQIAEGSPEAFRLQTGFSDAVRGLHLYGRKVTRPSNLVQCLVTPGS